MKEKLRYHVATAASYIEIIISILVLIGICFAGIDFIREVFLLAKGAILGQEVNISIETYLGAGLQLVIGVEFVKMIAKHTMSSTVEVLVYAIARKLVISHGTAIDVLFEVVAIAILFAIKRYLKEAKCKEQEEKSLNFIKQQKLDREDE